MTKNIFHAEKFGIVSMYNKRKVLGISPEHDIAKVARRNDAPPLRLALEVHQSCVGSQRSHELGILGVDGVPLLPQSKRGHFI